MALLPVLVAAVPTPKPQQALEAGPGLTHFMAKGQANKTVVGQTLQAEKAKVDPPLQTKEVYEEDYPVDMAKLTPDELRNVALSSYAKAISSLKKEAAEAEDAKKALQAQLQDLEASKVKAKAAADKALRAKQHVEKLRKEFNTLNKKAAGEAGEATEAKGVVTKEQSEYDAAVQAFKDAETAEAALRAKIADLDKRHKELCKESLTLEEERTAALGESGNANAKVMKEAGNVQQAKADLKKAQDAAAQAAAKAAAAEAAAAEAKAKLAAAEAALQAGNGKEEELRKKIEVLKKIWEEKKEELVKEQNDVKAAEKRVARAKANLAKYEPRQSAGHRSTAALAALILAALLPTAMHTQA